jgi:sugar O-acyltransferase (sialic acid O-acetyltransferase NeuD family)
MSKDLVLYGASNPCSLKILEAINRERPTWDVVGFIDDTPEKSGQMFYGFPILGGQDRIHTLDLDNTFFFNNVFGTMAGRKKVAQICEENRCQLVSLITPGIDLSFTKVGIDVAIEAQVAIDADVNIGDHSCVKRSASLGHEVILDKFVFIGPGATVCGRVKIQEGAYVGAGSCILPELEIGENSIIGAGAVVTRSVQPDITVYGNPAKQVNQDSKKTNLKV